MCISKAIREWSLRDISDLVHFIGELKRNRTGSSDQSSGSGIDIDGAECALPMDPFSLVVVGFYKKSFNSESKVA